MTEPAPAINVLVVDDQAVVRAGYASILNAEPDITVVGEAADGDRAVSLARLLRPDVVLMDIRMPGTDGLAATSQLTEEAPDVRVIVLTTFDLDEYVYTALRAGACGFLLKDVTPDDLIGAVRTVVAGEAMLAPAITRRLIDSFVSGRLALVPPAKDLLGRLSARETEVLTLLAGGLSNVEIGAALFVAPSTVKTHINVIFRKLGVRDRVQATIFAYDAGLVRPLSS